MPNICIGISVSHGFVALCDVSFTKTAQPNLLDFGSALLERRVRPLIHEAANAAKAGRYGATNGPYT